MRFFIALEISTESRSEIEEVQTEISRIFPGIRLTDPEKLHITIAFVGEREDDLKQKLIQVITSATENVSPFFLTPAYLDGFPHLHTAHTLWIGVKGDIDKLMLIRERIKDSLVELKIEVDERRYTPHIAIAKAQSLDLNSEREEEIQEIMSREFSPIKIESVKLFESIPERGFHSHNTLAEIKLT